MYIVTYYLLWPVHFLKAKGPFLKSLACIKITPLKVFGKTSIHENASSSFLILDIISNYYFMYPYFMMILILF
ncbi:hypothetical protein C1645_790312 [Glomus cerebriforme]|uniref:Uncharacterized protein n=1 Tax=Glomus cerebriforme TaxID=658196 RepID=A0A397S511_9GLOM|nr:hypothetical protein C1645_790312 [Glomus cerebriforme]